MCADGVWMCADGVWMCADGVRMCVDGVWMCADGVWMVCGCVWMCADGVWMCADGVWMCADVCKQKEKETCFEFNTSYKIAAQGGLASQTQPTPAQIAYSITHGEERVW